MLDRRAHFGARTLLLVACGCASGSQAPNTMAPTAPAPPAAADDAPGKTAVAAEAKACGGFEKRARAKKASLLGDRLFVTPLEGMESSSPPHDVMAGPVAEEQATRLLSKEGEHKLVVFSEELFARS